MKPVVNSNPLIDLPPQEVPLKNAPLVRVIAQMRFPPILSIEKKEVVSSFQEAIREQYPTLKPEHTQNLIFDPQGVVLSDSQITWRFIDATNSWRVSLATNFLALETSAYSSRSDFLERFKNVVTALHENFKLTTIERFGLRYIDRLQGEDMEHLSLFVRPEIAGIITSEFGDCIQQTINESVFTIPNQGEHLTARWGLLPVNKTFDPNTIEPIDQQSWILDLDMSSLKERNFSIPTLMEEAKHFSQRLYAFFRWVVTDEFLRYFGGEL
jgi:uncharacterized protein (TIGR04255 family)